MCDICGKNTDRVDITLTFNSAVQLRICPNCVVDVLAYQCFDFKDGIYTSEITGDPGAIMIDCQQGEVYYLTPDEAVRLLGHALMPDEWRTLAEKHGAESFMLHSDFYDENGYAWSPYIWKQYVHNLKYYKETHHLSEKEIKDIDEVLEEYEDWE